MGTILCFCFFFGQKDHTQRPLPSTFKKEKRHKKSTSIKANLTHFFRFHFVYSNENSATILEFLLPEKMSSSVTRPGKCTNTITQNLKNYGSGRHIKVTSPGRQK